MQVGNGKAVWGLPVPVNADGEIILPHFEEVAVNGRTVSEASLLLRELCIARRLAREDEKYQLAVSVSMLLKSYESGEIRAVTGSVPLTEKVNE